MLFCNGRRMTYQYGQCDTCFRDVCMGSFLISYIFLATVGSPIKLNNSPSDVRFFEGLQFIAKGFRLRVVFHDVFIVYHQEAIRRLNTCHLS